ncbi:MAG: site-specific integrase, partial [Bacillota bacterium]|nr:site-specific integrase [Bacillota bacterium]
IMLDYAMKYYGLSVNYVAIYGRFQEKKDKIITDDKLRYITYDDFNKFISVIDDIMWKTFFIFAYYTGCRKGEIFALTWKDINFNNNMILINKTLNEEIKGKYVITATKNNKSRKIQMSRTLIEELKEYKQKMLTYSNFKEDWFVFGGPIHFSKTTVDRYKHNYFKLSGVDEITMHEFRHSHVSLLINEYIKSGQTDTTKFFLMMSDRMGHTIDVMQKTYMHLFPTVQNEIVDILNNL